jgi:cytoskeletal protein RodZ
MKSKAFAVHAVPMNDATRPLTTRSRDRALDRLRTLTAGAALVGFAGTGAFGALAALNYAGHSTTTTGTTGSSSTNASSGSNSNTGSSRSDTSTNSGTTSNDDSSNTDLFQAAQLPTTQGTGSAHVSTGGSGG